MVTHNIPWLRWSICFSKCGTHLHSPRAYPPDVDGSSAWALNKLSPLEERASPVSSPVGQHPASTCLPLPVRMWVYDFHVAIYPQSVFIWHEAYWIQDPLVEESTRGHQGTQRATWLLSPGSCHNAMWLPWNLKDFLEDIGWRLDSSATKKHTPPSNGGRGQSLFSPLRILPDLSLSAESAREVVLDVVCSHRASTLFQNERDPWLTWKPAPGPALATWCLSRFGWACCWLLTTQRDPSML